MAAIEVIRKAGGDLEDAVMDLRNFIEVCESIDADNPPPWLYAVSKRLAVIHDTSQAYLHAVAKHALPYLRDLDAFAAKGGMGAVAPMVTKVVSGQSVPSRT